MGIHIRTTWQLVLGYVAAFVGLLAFCVGSASVQALQGAIPDFQLSAYRCFGQIFIYTFIIKVRKMTFAIRREDVSNMVCFSFTFVLYNVGYFGCTAYLPLATAGGVSIIITMATVLIHTKILIHEDIKKIYIGTFALCSIGIVLLIQPMWLFPGEDNAIYKEQSSTFNHSFPTTNQSSIVLDTKNIAIRPNDSLRYDTATRSDSSEGLPALTLGYLLAAIGAISLGLGLDINSILLGDVEPLIKAAYVSAIGCVASVCGAFYLEEITLYLTGIQIIFLLLHCGACVLINICGVYSSHMLGGIRVSLIHSVEVLLMLGMQETIMKSIMPGHGNWLEIVGTIMIVVGVSIAPTVDALQYYRQSTELP